MKKLICLMILVLTMSTSYGQEKPMDTSGELADLVAQLQKAMDENGIKCDLRLRPISNLFRLIVSSSVKISGSCEDKDGTEISAMVKMKPGEDQITIHKLTFKIKNIVIPH